MPTVNLTPRDRERYVRARALGQLRSQDPFAIIGARYNRRRNTVDLSFASGGTMSIPRELIPGLEDASTPVLASVSVSPAGDAISWRSLDIDVSVPGLIERAFGTRPFAAASGRRGGQKRSKSKAAAAKANGAKGGRPRKHVLA